jgi:hypothetical protein
VLDYDARRGERVLSTVHEFLGRFVAYPSDHARLAHTLWIVHKIGKAIEDGVLKARWADQRSRWGSSSPIHIPDDATAARRGLLGEL